MILSSKVTFFIRNFISLSDNILFSLEQVTKQQVLWDNHGGIKMFGVSPRMIFAGSRKHSAGTEIQLNRETFTGYRNFSPLRSKLFIVSLLLLTYPWISHFSSFIQYMIALSFLFIKPSLLFSSTNAVSVRYN